MRTDFGDLVIEQAIVHVVPHRRRTDRTEDIRLSETVCRMNDDVRTALQGKLRTVLASLGREIVEDPNAKSTLPNHVHDFLMGERDLVDVSGDMVHLLLNSQSGVSPAGLLLVASAQIEGDRALLLVKLEQETGMQAQETTTDGLRTFDVKYFADLLLTEKSKVYKAALFPATKITEDGLEGWAADRQLAGRMANFFLERFLGCKQKNEPREVTRSFHEAATEWINKSVTDPDVRIDYVMAIMSELQSPDVTLDPTAFAQKHLKLTHQDDFLGFLETRDVPNGTFDKNVELIENKLKRVRVGFADGAFIVAPIDSMHEGGIFSISDQGDGTAIVTITGTVTTATAYSPPGGGRRSPEKGGHGNSNGENPPGSVQK